MNNETLSAQLDAEARERAIDKFGPQPTAEQFENVRQCEWDIFTFHAATGGDADCWCGAHVSDLRPAAAVDEQENGGDRLYRALALFDTRDGSLKARIVQAAREGWERSGPDMGEPEAWDEFDRLIVAYNAR